MRLVFDVLPVDREFGRTVAVEREAYPAPEVSSRDEVWVAAPRAFESLAGYARMAGWAVRAQYSRGRRPHGSTGRPLAVKSLWGLRMARPGWGAYVIHDGDCWSDVWMWGQALHPFGLGGVTDLRTWLAGPERDTGWYDAIRDRVREQAERAREAARTRVKKGSGEAL